MEYLPNFLSRAHAAEDAVDGSDIAHYRVYYGSDVGGNVNTERFDPNIKITFDRSDEDSIAEAQAELYDVIRKKDTVRRVSWLGAGLGGAALVYGSVLGVTADQPSRSDTTPVASADRGAESPQPAQKQITLNPQVSSSPSSTPSLEPSPSQGPPRIKIVEKEVPVPVEGPTVYVTETAKPEPQPRPYDNKCVVLNKGEVIMECPDEVEQLSPLEIRNTFQAIFNDLTDLFPDKPEPEIEYALNTTIAALGIQNTPAGAEKPLTPQERMKVTARLIKTENVGFGTINTTNQEERNYLLEDLNGRYALYPGSAGDGLNNIFWDTKDFSQVGQGDIISLTGTNGKPIETPVVHLKDNATDQEFVVLGFYGVQPTERASDQTDHQVESAQQMSDYVADVTEKGLPVYLVGDTGESESKIYCELTQEPYLSGATQEEGFCKDSQLESSTYVFGTEGTEYKVLPVSDSSTFEQVSPDEPFITKIKLPHGFTPPDVPVEEAPTPPAPASYEVVIAQANEKVGMLPAKFKHDLRIILSHNPDFITLNESSRRSDELITPAGYDMHRGEGEYQSGTPVLWRTDTWKLSEQNFEDNFEGSSGTHMVSNRPDLKWATTAVNWVTLEDTHGNIVSVISAHLPPALNDNPERRANYVRAVSELNEVVDELSQRGEVLIGGDLNRHFRIHEGKLHPALRGIHDSGMISSYEEGGEPKNGWGTGNNGGNGTIDYILRFDEGKLQFVSHLVEERTVSDHDALIAKYAYKVKKVSEPESPDTSSNPYTETTVASMNVLGWGHTDRGGNKPRYRDGTWRQPKIHHFMRQQGIEIAGFQEFVPRAQHVWKQKYGDTYGIYPGKFKNSQNAVVYDKRSWKLLEGESYTVDVPYFYGNMVNMPVAILESRKNPGHKVAFVSFHNPINRHGRNHEQHRDEDIERQKAVVRDLHQKGYPVIIAGDANEVREYYCKMTENNSLEVASGGSNGPEQSCKVPGIQRIDFVLGSAAIKFSDYEVHRLNQKPLGQRITDHPFIVSDAAIPSS